MSVVSCTFHHPSERVLISEFITKRLVQNLPISESKARAIARKTLKLVGAIFLTVTNIAFIEDSYNLGKDNPPWGVTIATADTLSYLSLSIWLLSNLVDSYLQKYSEEERALYQKEKISICAQITIFSIAASIGALLQVPLAWRYTTLSREWFPPFVMAASVMCTDSLFPIRSLVMLQEKAIRCRRIDEATKDFDRLRLHMVSLLEKNITLLEASQSVVPSYLRKEDFLRSLTDSSSFKVKKSKFVTIASTVTGGTISLVQMFVLGVLAYQGTNAMTNNFGLSVTAFVTSVIANLYLQGGSTINMCRRICTVIKNTISRFFQTSIEERLSPLLAFSLETVSIAISVLSYPTTLQIVPSLESISQSLDLFISITFCTGMTLLLLRALLDITGQIVRFKVHHLGTHEEKALLTMYEKLSRLSTLLKKSSIKDFVCFLNNEDPKIISNIQTDMALKQGDLKKFILEHSESHEELHSLNMTYTTNYRSLHNT